MMLFLIQEHQGPWLGQLVCEDDLTGEATTIRYAYGDVALYPLAIVEISVESCTMEVEAAVSMSLSMSVLVGTDIMKLKALLKEEDKCMVVMTRSCCQEQANDERRRAQLVEEQKAKVTTVDQVGEVQGAGHLEQSEDKEVFLINVHYDLLGPQKDKEQLSWRQRRWLKQQFRQGQ